jgi:hypothetical protein
VSGYAAKYRVLLRPDIAAREAGFFSALGAEVAGPERARVFQLTCTEVSFSHGRYLEMRVFREPETWLLPVFIPHELVLLVFGPTGEAFPLAGY